MRKITDTSKPIELREYISGSGNSCYINYADNEIHFNLRLNKTEYEVNSRFDVSGKKTIFEQFKNLILSQN